MKKSFALKSLWLVVIVSFAALVIAYYVSFYSLSGKIYSMSGNGAEMYSSDKEDLIFLESGIVIVDHLKKELYFVPGQAVDLLHSIGGDRYILIGDFNHQINLNTGVKFDRQTYVVEDGFVGVSDPIQVDLHDDFLIPFRESKK